MSQVHFLLVADDETGDRNITVFVSGAEKPYTAHNSHPNFDEILSRALDGDESVTELFDVAETVAARFDPLSERVAVANGRVYFDGDEVDDSLTQQIVRFLNEGEEDWIPLVNFMENVAANPLEHSREQLYEWLRRHEFTITDEGELVAYKGLKGDLTSIQSGPGIVNGQRVNGHLDNAIGNVVEIARSYVQHDPAQGCAQGLHVGTFEYANGWAQGALVKVLVNPRDVVSVPTDCNAQKVRVCRYRVVEQIDAKVTAPLDTSDYDFDDDWAADDYDDFDEYDD